MPLLVEFGSSIVQDAGPQGRVHFEAPRVPFGLFGFDWPAQSPGVRPRPPTTPPTAQAAGGLSHCYLCPHVCPARRSSRPPRVRVHSLSRHVMSCWRCCHWVPLTRKGPPKRRSCCWYPRAGCAVCHAERILTAGFKKQGAISNCGSMPPWSTIWWLSSSSFGSFGDGGWGLSLRR